MTIVGGAGRAWHVGASRSSARVHRYDITASTGGQRLRSECGDDALRSAGRCGCKAPHGLKRMSTCSGTGFAP